MIKRFPNDLKRYSSHLQVSILHRLALTKVYLTIYKSLKNRYLKSFLYHKYRFLANLNPRAVLYGDNGLRIEVGLQLY